MTDMLFEKGEWWEDSYEGMPAFEQEDQQPWKSVIVHFENAEDMADFAKRIDQKVGPRTRSMWHPEAEIGLMSDKCFIDAADSPKDASSPPDTEPAEEFPALPRPLPEEPADLAPYTPEVGEVEEPTEPEKWIPSWERE